MDSITGPESEYTNRNPERALPLLHLTPAPIAIGADLSVMILCAKKLVVFTNDDSEAKVCRALESGASGYLLYGVGIPELVEGIRSVRDGGVALSPLAAARIANRFQRRNLTPREKAVLAQLALGLCNKAIAHKLHLAVGTVKTHVKAILEKLEAGTRTAAVMAAQRRGLLP